MELTKYIKQDINKKPYYNLIGILEHNGSESGGHYTSKCKNFVDEKWYKFNDSFVDEITSSNNNENINIKSRSVMLLFYQRKNLK